MSDTATDQFWKLRPNAPQSGYVLGDPMAITEGGAKEFIVGRGRSAFRMFVVRRDREYRGYLNLCPHFSLPLNHASDAFMRDGLIECAQHFARFEFEDGRCAAGACEGEGLTAVPVIVSANGLLIIA